MSLLGRLWNLIAPAIPTDKGPVPLIMNVDYLNDVDFVAAEDPLITSDDFVDFISMFGLSCFDEFINAIGIGHKHRTLYYPDTTHTKKQNGHDPLAICMSFHGESPLALFSLLGPVTEMHAIIKAPAQNGGVFQLDHVCIIDDDVLYDIPCGQDYGNAEILRRMIACFAKGVDNIRRDMRSINIDAELELWRGLKPELEALEAFWRRQEVPDSAISGISPPACG